jgi:ribonucleoside-diphosphate reductase alpha chain
MRSTLAGTFPVINKYLVKDLMDEGLWDENRKNDLLRTKGSIQKMMDIPQHIRNLYKTAWEVKQRVVIDQAADRGQYIDQSQSMNLFLAKRDSNIVHNMLRYGWEKGLKTGIYYLRSQAGADAIQFNLGIKDCEMCGS